MKSLFAKILIWFWATLAVTIIGSGLITAIMINSSERQPPLFAASSNSSWRRRAQAYETGGRAALARFMRALQNVFEGRAMLTDAAGKDLLTGQDAPTWCGTRGRQSDDLDRSARAAH